jgi:RimJ/RimL family protein N-acetyltransferase
VANVEAAAELQREIAAGNQSETMLKWGLALRESNAVIGTTTLFNLSLDNGRAEIGYALARAYWGKGYMHEALQALLSHAFDVMQLRRLEADVFNVRGFFVNVGTSTANSRTRFSTVFSVANGATGRS